MCMEPVGEGAIRVTTGRSDIEMEGPGEAAVASDAWAAPLSMRARARPSLAAARDWLAGQAARQADRWTLWTPVALGLGAALYFVLPNEPQSWLALVCAVLVVGLLALAARHGGARAVTAAVVLMACAIGGFGVAKLRTDRVKAPIAPADSQPQRLEGWVVDVAAPGAAAD